MYRQKGFLVIIFIVLAIIYAIAVINLRNTPQPKYSPEGLQLFENLTENNGADSARQHDEVNKEILQMRVRKLLLKDNVSLRADVNDVFLLGDIYADEGKHKEAITFYQKALQVDVWRLDYQLKLARLLEKQGQTDQAAEKAKIVYHYAEEENLIKDAQNFLAQLSAGYARNKSPGDQECTEYVEIVMVPIGKVSDMLLCELKETLQKNIGIKYSVSDKTLNIGKPDRSQADKFLTQLVERIESNLSAKLRREIMSEIDADGTSLETYEGKRLFVTLYLLNSTNPTKEMQRFYKALEKYEKKGQYDAKRLLSNLSKTFRIKRGSNIKGYLGITEQDIFTKDFNFLYGWAHKGYGVMSYHRFRAKFNNEPPNRDRLLKRTAKQGISSSFFILGIPRCTTPTCARAYPHNLREHDQKGFEICASCREKLNEYIRKSK